jgi:capsular polysaccharide transport system permease protein
MTSDVVRLVETLVNRISLRARLDSLTRAEGEVATAAEKLTRVREKVLKFRNLHLTMDPASSGASLGDAIGKLSLERIDLISALSTLSTSLSVDAPSQRLQRARIAAIDQQIADLRKRLADDSGTDAIATQIASYESLKLEEQFAERMYMISQNALEISRQDKDRQQLFLITIVRPSMPETATYPRVTANCIMLFSSLLVAWAIVVLIVANINDQMI